MILTLELREKIKQTVIQAGCLIEDVKGVSDRKSKEGFSNFVTKYDSKVQDFLISHFRVLLPEAAFMCEEDGYSDFPSLEGYTFIIDPIDGTSNFIYGFPCSAISVALAFRQEIVYGIVYNPFQKELYEAQREKGAYLNNSPITLSDLSLSEGLTHFGGAPYYTDLHEKTYAMMEAISYHTVDLRELGAASLGLCFTAAGRCIAYASPLLRTWDYAASSVILEEAGGLLTDFHGDPLLLRDKVSVAGGSPKAHKELLALIHPLL